MYTFQVSLDVDGRLVQQVVDNCPNEGAANVEAYRLVKARHRASSVEVVDYLTVYMGKSAEQIALPGVE